MSEPSLPHKRHGRLSRSLSAVVVLLAVAGYLMVQYAAHGPDGPGCRVVSDHQNDKAYEFTPEQAVNAATISAVGTSRGLPERAVTIALATALQESQLRNLGYGDRDSLGLFQQRPSQGWGTEAQIMDPDYAADQFYAHLTKVPGYLELPLTEAAQRVQRSGFPDAYAKHEKDAELLAAALTGHAAATLSCQGRPAPKTDGGPDAVRAALARDFGRDVLQQAGAEVTPDPADAADASVAADAASGAQASVPAPASASASPTRTGTLGRGTAGDPRTPGSTGDPGATATSTATDTATGTAVSTDESADESPEQDRTVTLPVPESATKGKGKADGASGTDGGPERGWQLAHWAVANASELHIERVSFAGREWRAGTGATRNGWRAVSAKDDAWADGPEKSRGAVRITTSK